MARPRKWNSEAERLAAYRAAKAQDVDPALPERQVEEPPAPVEPKTEMVLFEGKLVPKVNFPAVSLEQYLRHELSITKHLLRNGLKEVEHNGEGVMQRSERYLRWRYAGFTAGEIASL